MQHRALSSFPALLLLCLFPSFPARSECGLHPVPSLSRDASSAWVLGTSLRRSGIEHAGESGTFSELGLTAGYAARGNWSLGWQWPLSMLRYRNALHIGMGNPTFNSELRFSIGSALGLATGAVLGLPLGNIGDGLASDHFMGTAYASLSANRAGLDWNGTVGTASMLPWMDASMGGMDPGGSMAGMDHSALHGGAAGNGSALAGLCLGSPHENWELLYRISARKGLASGRVALAAALDGQHILSEPMHMTGMQEDTGRDFLSTEFSVSVTLGAGSLSPYVQAPVSHARRTGFSLGMRTSYGL